MNLIAELESLRIQNHGNTIFSYLKINSVRNKFGNLKLITGEYFDILCAAEIKIDKSSQTAQFNFSGYQKPYRLDISDN